MEVSFYRLKSDHSIYLVRNSIVGGGSTTPWYDVTTDIWRAIESYLRTTKNEGSFESKFKVFDQFTPVKYTSVREMEFDGYKGVLKKEVTFSVTDFEKVTLVEKE